MGLSMELLYKILVLLQKHEGPFDAEIIAETNAETLQKSENCAEMAKICKFFV